MECRRQDALDIVRCIAQKRSEETGKTYSECISFAIDKACSQLGVSTIEYLKIIKPTSQQIKR